MPAKASLIGQRFTRLLVIADAPSRRFPCGKMFHYSLCLCDCGNKKEVLNSHLRTGKITSCRCLWKEVMRRANLVHGHALEKGAAPIYSTWCKMMERCTNPLRKEFKNYGARGIRVCERWREFENFLADMGEKPTGLTIDRINNNGNYEPGNCRWATQVQQQRNKRNNRIFTVRGTTGCLQELCEYYGLYHGLVQYRIDKLGWSVEDAFTIKPRPKRLSGKANIASQPLPTDGSGRSTLNLKQAEWELG